MFKTKNRYARNDLEKECKVLLLRLSKSKIASLQENPKQIKGSLDLPYRSRRLTNLEVGNAMKNASKTTASYLPEKTPYVLIKEISELPLQAARKTKSEEASRLRTYFGYEVYLEMFEQYLKDLRDNPTQMKKMLSEKNINKELFISNRVSRKKSNNIKLIKWIVKRFRKRSISSLQISAQSNIIKEAANKAMEARQEELQQGKGMPKKVVSDNEVKIQLRNVPSTKNKDLLFIDVPTYKVDPSSTGGAPKNIGAEQHSSKYDDIPDDEHKEERTIGCKDYLLPIDAPAIPKSAIPLVSNCPGYLNNLTETDVNGNRMWLESAYQKDQAEINAIREKMRNKDLGNNQKKNIAQISTRKKGKILTNIFQIKYPRGFLNDFLSQNHFL